MKGLIFLMIVCSLFINFSVNKFGWLILYKMEFPNPADFARLEDAFFIVIIWILLVLSHAATISLLFLTHKKYFSALLFCAPLLFIQFFLFLNFLTIPMLVPFLIVWIIALVKDFKWKIKYRVEVEPLIVAMLILSLIIGINIDRNVFSLFTVEFLSPFFIIESGNYTFWESLLRMMLVLTHVGLISMIFLMKKHYFNQILTWIPALFIGLFAAFNYMAFYLLIPFLVVWAIALPRQKGFSTVLVNAD